MRRRWLIVIGLAATVFVGVMLMMVSAEAHVIRHGLPVATAAALAAAVITWRWSAHVD